MEGKKLPVWSVPGLHFAVMYKANFSVTFHEIPFTEQIIMERDGL